MIDTLMKEARRYGDRLQIVPIERLQDLKDEIARFQTEYNLNGFQKHIVNSLYSYEIPKTPYSIRSIIIVAMPHSAYAKVIFRRNGKDYTIYGLVSSDQGKTEQYIAEALNQGEYHMAPAPNLPLKRLAVQSGLAEYGRNNITYVPDMGSHLSYAAFFTDVPCLKDPWREARSSNRCQNCMACIKSCPTGAIRKDVFLIDNSKCLSALNESADDFPGWLPFSVHHTIYDCLRCQINCPMNADFNSEVVGPIHFDMNETERIIKGPPYNNTSPELREKINILALDKWPDGIPRNLLLLFDLMDNGHIPSLR